MTDIARKEELLKSKLDELRADFRRELEKIRRDLFERREAIGDTRYPDAKEADKICAIAHRLSGSAGAFGFGDLSDGGYELEALFNADAVDPVSLRQSCDHIVFLIDEILSSADGPYLSKEIRIEPQNKPARITYVEDEADIREIGEISLTSIGGYEVDVCADGYDALARTPCFAPDIIILDVMMPGINGVETYKRLRSNPALKAVPVVFMTARVQETEIAEYRALGCTDVIAKPFDPMQLPDQIERIWQRANGVLPVGMEAQYGRPN